MVEEEIPYEWPATSNVPSEILHLWTEVENGLEKNQTGASCGKALPYWSMSCHLFFQDGRFCAWVTCGWNERF